MPRLPPGPGGPELRHECLLAGYESRVRRDTGALSTSASQVDLSPTWKQEVNRRVAEHKNRKGISAVEPQSHPAQHGASARAAQAAARVAARYANAPSYSEILAGEARAAVQAAEAASRAALQAQAAAESVLAGIEAASGVAPAWEPEAIGLPEPEWNLTAEPALPDPPQASPAFERPSLEIRWEPDMPAREAEPAAAHATHGSGALDIQAEDWPARDALDAEEAEEIEVVEPAKPIHANLIQFPREIVATRKARPRLAEGAYTTANEPDAQLSIFEVDPGATPTQPEAAAAVPDVAAPSWPAQDWSGIKLNEEPLIDLQEDLLDEPDPETAVPALQPASISLRLMAVVVDSSLIAGAFLTAAMVAASHAVNLPTIRQIEQGAALGLVAIAVLYHVLFFILARATPGMKYAHISLCTFKDELPTRAQRCGRLGALLLSLLPVGLGIVWAIFDEDHLSWHDRLSGAYLRKC